MRVLHVYSGNLYGGIETLLATLARRSKGAEGFEHHFALCFDGRLRGELIDAGANVTMLGAVRISRPGTILRGRRRLRSLLESGGYGAGICHSSWSAALFGPVVRRVGLPLVFWSHDAAAGNHWLDRWASHVRPSLAICNSHFTQSALANIYPLAPSQVLRYPVETNTAADGVDLATLRDTVRAELGASSNAIVIIQASRLERWKGHVSHLQGLAKLRHLPDWVCWQVGGPQRASEVHYFNELRHQAADLGIAERVRFVGQRQDVRRLLAAADIYCQPNTGPEPFGISFIEALGSGLPVVTTAIGAAPEIVTDRCGILVARNDAKALAGALEDLTTNQALRIRLGQGGRLRARQLCDPERQIYALNRLLATLSTESVATRKAVGYGHETGSIANQSSRP